VAELLRLDEAVRELVHDGDSVALEGFTHLIPFAAGHEIVRQRRRELTLIRMTPDLIYDQLIGMRCARKLVFSWGGNPGVGSLHRFRDAVEADWPVPLELEEHTYAGMANRYAAGAAQLPFGAARLRGNRPDGALGDDRADRVPVHARDAHSSPGDPSGRRHRPSAAGRP
jgi:glutaconate CoA-transferase subunit A